MLTARSSTEVGAPNSHLKQGADFANRLGACKIDFLAEIRAGCAHFCQTPSLERPLPGEFIIAPRSASEA